MLRFYTTAANFLKMFKILYFTTWKLHSNNFGDYPHIHQRPNSCYWSFRGISVIRFTDEIRLQHASQSVGTLVSVDGIYTGLIMLSYRYGILHLSCANGRFSFRICDFLNGIYGFSAVALASDRSLSTLAIG